MTVPGGLPAFLRTASVRDAAAIRELLVETWHATYDGLYGPDRVREITNEWHSIAAIEARMAVPESEFVLADDGSRILGLAYALAHGDHVDLKQLYVHPAAQGRGIGAMLLDEIADCVDEAHAILLEVEAGNTGAVAFYRKQEFIEVDRQDSCNGQPGFDTILMSKHIPSG